MPATIERPRALSDQVAAALERRIRTGKITPLSRLPSERELCAEFGVSRIVVREAIARLKADGYVETRQGAVGSVPSEPGVLSYRIPAISRMRQQDLSHIMELRFVVEVVAAQLAALRRDDSDLNAMQASVDAMREALRNGDDGSRADDEFHYAIAAAPQNPHLRRFVIFLRHQFGAMQPPTWNPKAHRSGEARRAQIQHEQILESIRSRDVQGAGHVAAEHLIDSAVRLGLRGAAKWPRIVMQGIDDWNGN